MPKLRKQRRKKVFRHNVNRKRLRNRMFSKGSIGCKEVKNAWDQKKSVQGNLEEMGLSYDPNQTIAIPKRKKPQPPTVMEVEEPEEAPVASKVPSKKFVAEALEADAKAPREKRLRLPKSQVEWITYLLKKYGCDYKAMARDSKNYQQETWKQLRQKVRLFRKIPEQYEEYLKQPGAKPVESDCEDMSDGEI